MGHLTEVSATEEYACAPNQSLKQQKPVADAATTCALPVVPGIRIGIWDPR